MRRRNAPAKLAISALRDSCCRSYASPAGAAAARRNSPPSHSRPSRASSRSPDPHDGAYVYDLTAKQPLFSERATTLRPPASVEKLYTATAALERAGPDRPAEHERLRGRAAGARRVWEGSLYLRGGGDPTFGTQRLHRRPLRRHRGERLGARPQTRAHDGIHRITGSVRATSPSSTPAAASPRATTRSDPFLEGTLSGLAFNRGESGTNAAPTPPPHTRRVSFGSALKATA